MWIMLNFSKASPPTNKDDLSRTRSAPPSVTLDPMPSSKDDIALNFSSSGDFIHLPWLPQRGKLVAQLTERGI